MYVVFMNKRKRRTKMNKKKLLATVLTAAMATSIFTVCPYAEEASSDEEITLTFGFWGDEAEASMKMRLAEAYMEENPNVTIEFEYCNGSDYLTKMQTWFSSGETPDVFGIANDHLIMFQDSELFEDLAPYVEADGLESMWDYESAQETYTIENGRLTAVPFVTKTFAIAYNKDLFDQAGVEYPTDDWTEADMLEAAEKISALGDDIYGIRWGVRVPEFYRGLYGDMYYNYEDKTMNVADNESFKAAVTMFSDSILNGLAPDETSGTISTGGFETGNFGMALSATWDIATYTAIGDSFAWDVVMLPVNEEYGRWQTTLRANGWGMSANAENKEACWDFIKFLSTSETAAVEGSSIGIPCLTSYVESDEYLNDFGEGTEYNKQVFIDMVAESVPLYNLGAFAEVNDLAMADYEMILAGQMTVDEMISDLDMQGSSIFASYAE